MKEQRSITSGCQDIGIRKFKASSELLKDEIYEIYDIIFYCLFFLQIFIFNNMFKINEMMVEAIKQGDVIKL